MKKIISILMAVLMLASLLTVYSSARGYTLSLPSTLSSHNLAAYGLDTLNAFSTTIPPTIDGAIGTGEYPGYNNGCAKTATLNDGLWMSSHTYSSTGAEGGYNGSQDFTGLTSDKDVPEYIKTYLTYDQEFLYFAIATVIQPQSKSFCIDTWLNFIQSEHIYESSSAAWTRYNISNNPTATQATSAYIFCASDSTKSGRSIKQIEDDVFLVTQQLDFVIGPDGTKWHSAAYVMPENFTYKITVLSDGRWNVVFEGRQALCDVLRITDVEYEDGTPIDYVPEWGSFGTNIRLFATEATTDIRLKETIYAQTMLPCYGAAYTSVNSTISGITFSNALSSAQSSRFGTTQPRWMNPVHFLGVYDAQLNDAGYGAVYSQVQATAGKTTTRITRNRNIALTSAERGLAGRVIGVATRASEGTGDSLTITLICIGAMAVCAAAAVAVVFMKKRSSHR